MLRKIAISLWLFVVLCALVAYVIWPQAFDPSSIARLLNDNRDSALILYLILSVVRGFTLVPSTTLVIAGTLAFPAEPWLVLAISIAGITASSSMIYWFSESLGMAEHFEMRKPSAVARIRRRLEHPTGIGFVFLWAFFPLVPTDAVCYVAGSTRMHFGKFIAAITAGELVLCCFYVFSFGWAINKFA